MAILKAFLGKENVLEVRDLLVESTRDEESKYEVINKITDFKSYALLLYSSFGRLILRTIGGHPHYGLFGTGKPNPF